MILRCLRRVLVLSCLLLPVAHADIVWLHNGDRLTGTVRSLEHGVLVFDTEHAGTVRIAWDAVSNLETDEPVMVTARDDQAALARFDAVSAEVLDDDEARDVALDDVERIVRPRPFLRDLQWEGNLDVGLQHRRASINTSDYDLALQTRLRQGAWRHGLQAGYHRGREGGTITADNANLQYSLDRFVTEQAFVQGRAYLRHDRIEELRRQSSIAVGPGYQFWDDELGAFSLTALAGRLHYRYDDGSSEAGYAIGIGWDYRRQLFGERLQLYALGEAARPLSGVADLSLKGEAGLRYRLNDRLSVYIKYARNLVRGSREEADERIYGTGLGLTW